MGVIIPSIENKLIDIIRQDLSESMKNIIIKNNINKDNLIGPHKRTLIQICAYYGSTKCLNDLINMDYDINELEYSSNNSPLFIACKFNYIEIVYLLLNNHRQKCITLRKNNEGLNEFEVAFLRGNYEICYYLLYEYEYEHKQEKAINNFLLLERNKNKIKDSKEAKQDHTNENNEYNENSNEYLKFFNDINFCLEKYLGIQEYLSYPLFNMPLFYESLKKKKMPGENPSFEFERKKTKDLLTKIPDPNETWSNFMKRLANLELYNPPLIDKRTFRKTNSLYMKTQMKIISMEYGIKMDYCNPEDLIVNNNGKNYDNKDEEEKDLININYKEKNDEEKTKNEINDDELTQNKQYFKINVRRNENRINVKSKSEKIIKDKMSKIKFYTNFNNYFDNTDTDSEKKAISFTIPVKDKSIFYK